MSSLNIQNDLFLGRQELDRQSKFIKEDGYLRIIRSLINTFGIVNVTPDVGFTNFLVEAGTNSGTIKIAVDSYALDENMNIIYQEIIDNFAVTDDSSWYWVKIGYLATNNEKGTISIAANGDVTGVGTKFTECLRGQSNYPVKVNFPDSVSNTEDYQVVSVLSDTQMIISASSFTPENGIKYRVVGSTTPGITLVGDDRFPYIYDSCALSLVAEVALDVPPAKTEGEEFYIARVMNSSGSMTIQDKRTEFLST